MAPIEELATNQAKKAASFARDFRDFAFKGNIVDVAVGIIIGAAFAKVVDALVKNVIMPLISMVAPGDEPYSKWSVTLNGKEVPFGVFIAEIVNFLIIALVLYIFAVKFLGWLRRVRSEQESAAPPL